MLARPQGTLKLSEFEYLTPCFEWSAACNLDWAAVSAIGGWAAAIATLAAVVVALKAASAQTEAAKEAVIAERKKAKSIQKREWKANAKAQRRTAKQLAIGISMELGWAKRQLVARLISWDPFQAGPVSPDVVESYASDKPFSDLAFLQRCSDRLQGFADEEAVTLLRVLAAWHFFNWNPGNTVDQVGRRAEREWRGMTQPRVKIGLELLDLIESAILKMDSYHEGGAAVARTAMAQLPGHALEKLNKLRDKMKEG